MSFSEIELKKIDNLVGGLCRKHSPVLLRNELRMEYAIDGYNVLILECRPHWDNQSEWMQNPIAKIKFTRKTAEWTLYWQRANGKWISYEPRPTTKDLLLLVNEVDEDPLHTFFG